MADFAKNISELCGRYYPHMYKLLKKKKVVPHFIPFIMRDMGGVAHCSGEGLVFSSRYFSKAPKDYGAAIHEMVHSIQGSGAPSWIIEGIADHVRNHSFNYWNNPDICSDCYE